jgi:hypothetical protein
VEGVCQRGRMPQVTKNLLEKSATPAAGAWSVGTPCFLFLTSHTSLSSLPLVPCAFHFTSHVSPLTPFYSHSPPTSSLLPVRGNDVLHSGKQSWIIKGLIPANPGSRREGGQLDRINPAALEAQRPQNRMRCAPRWTVCFHRSPRLSDKSHRKEGLRVVLDSAYVEIVR